MSVARTSPTSRLLRPIDRPQNNTKGKQTTPETFHPNYYQLPKCRQMATCDCPPRFSRFSSRPYTLLLQDPGQRRRLLWARWARSSFRRSVILRLR